LNILIVKYGALGDVVRTSYFTKCLKDKYGSGLNLTWATSLAATPLLQKNIYIDEICTDFSKIQNKNFDIVYSLDDEYEIVSKVCLLSYKKIIGAYVDTTSKKVTYCEKSAEWFDMGLLSKLGKVLADQRKKSNNRSHGEIFAEIFDTNLPEPIFFGSQEYLSDYVENSQFRLGINPYAGGRWASKELRLNELGALIQLFLDSVKFRRASGRIILFGANEDRQKNLEIASRFSDESIEVANTDESVLQLASQIKSLNNLITSDSLAMHLAIAQKRPTLAFFAPTSSVEIDDFGLGQKLISTAHDYCSYKKDADNASITANRIFELFNEKYAF
jgi:heptosyltransferase-2